jgi:hypothetical protein
MLEALLDRAESAERKVAELSQLTLDQQHFNARLVAEAESSEHAANHHATEAEKLKARVLELEAIVERDAARAGKWAAQVYRKAWEDEAKAHAETLKLAAEENGRLKAEVAQLKIVLADLFEAEGRHLGRNDKPWTIHDGDSYADLVRNETDRKAWNAASDALSSSGTDEWLESVKDDAYGRGYAESLEVFKKTLELGQYTAHDAEVRAKALEDVAGRAAGNCCPLCGVPLHTAPLREHWAGFCQPYSAAKARTT